MQLVTATMCIAPVNVVLGTKGDYRSQLVACHNCWQCRENAINDKVGRNIAESKTSVACHAVTLTYGRNKLGDVDHLNASVLTYSDVQKYIKLLRFHGYPVRYFITGEYGSLKGRAHWHAMLYWQAGVPPHELDKTFMQAQWSHGWSFWTRPTHKAIRYNCKYITKDMGDDARQGHMSMSKKPPLGSEYFERVAAQFVRARLAPQSLEYSFPEVLDVHGKQIKFRLKDRPAELFIESYVRQWEAAYGREHLPNSELVEGYLDQWVRSEVEELRYQAEQRRQAFKPYRTRWGLFDDLDAFNQMERMRNGKARSRQDAEYTPIAWEPACQDGLHSYTEEGTCTFCSHKAGR